MKNKKLFIFFIAAFLFLVVAYLVWVLVQPKDLIKDNLISSQNLPVMVFPSPPPEVVNIPAYNVSVPKQAFPEKIISFKLKPLDNFALIGQKIATLLGFGVSPQIIKTSGQVFYIWNDEKSLTLKDSPPSVSYASPFTALTTVITNEEGFYTNMALSLLNRIFSFPAFVSLSSPDIKYSKAINTATEGQPTDKTAANLITLSYRFIIDGVPLYHPDQKNRDFVVVFDGSGNLVTFILNLYSFEKEGVYLPVVSFEEAKKTLLSQRGSLTYALSPEDEFQLRLISYNIPVINIDSLVLGYAPDPSKTQLLPVFVFSGTAVSISDNKEVNTVTFVSALP